MSTLAPGSRLTTTTLLEQSWLIPACDFIHSLSHPSAETFPRWLLHPSFSLPLRWPNILPIGPSTRLCSSPRLRNRIPKRGLWRFSNGSSAPFASNIAAAVKSWAARKNRSTLSWENFSLASGMPMPTWERRNCLASKLGSSQRHSGPSRPSEY